MEKLSVVILSHNNQDSIEACLSSVVFADEIILIDDNSTDRTLKIVGEFQSSLQTQDALDVFVHPLENDFAQQRNFGLEKTNGDWILFIDADEVVSTELRQEIINILTTPKAYYDGYVIRRDDYLFDKKLHFGETASVELLRLARKNSGVWVNAVHEVWQVNGGTTTLKNPLFHKRYLSVSEFLQRIHWYSQLRAEQLYREGKQEYFLQIFLNPILKFIVNYFFKLGFLDGRAGLIMAWAMSWHSFLVRVHLRLLRLNGGKMEFGI